MRPPAAIECRGSFLIVRFIEPQSCLSWAVVRGGRVRATTVAWYYLEEPEYEELHNAPAFLEDKLYAAGLHGAIGLMTSRKRYGHVEALTEYEEESAWCLVTVGLTNAIRCGDAPFELPPAATINILCWVSQSLDDIAMVEGIATAAEARTAAMLEARIPSGISGLPSTGTGTDCIVLASSNRYPKMSAAGKHTVSGHLIGNAVYKAVRRAVAEWVEEFGAT
jgi:adenosylcobinamide amidohydrolase